MTSRHALTASTFCLVMLWLLLAAGCGSGGGGTSPQAGPPSVPASLPAISGTFSAAAGSFIDSDVNDPNAPYSSNDTVPQVISNPFIVGGFTCATGTGHAGDRFETTPDPVDLYQAALSKGQTITLVVSDYDSTNPTRNDLNLFLVDPATPANNRSSMGSGPEENITVPADATYRIEVRAAAGASNYVLTVGAASPTAAARSVLRLEDDFVPGELIVRFKETEVQAASAITVQAQAAAVGLKHLAGDSGRPQLLSLGDPLQRQTARAILLPSAGDQVLPQSVQASDESALKHETLQTIKALRGRNEVLSADLNYHFAPMEITPSDQYYRLQWHYPLIHLPDAWAVVPDTTKVVVAVVDTGVFMDHVDLAASLLADGYDFISNPSSALDGDGIDPDPDDPGDSTTPSLSSFHGTHVAGTISAVSNNQIGVAGITWGPTGMSRILPVRVLGLGGGTSYDVIQGVRYAAGLSNDAHTTPAAAADIINLSLGRSGGFSQSEQDTFTEVRNQGILCIAAAGNESSANPDYPAAYDGVVSVSAVDINKNLAFYANFGPTVDVVAPGGDTGVDSNGDGYPDGVLSTMVDNSSGARESVYGFYSGTSMATPHVSGVAALMKAVDPALTPADFDVLLASGQLTEDLGAPGRDNIFGHGLIDALKAAQAANSLANGAQLPPLPLANPASLNFGTVAATLSFTISNGGGGSLTVTGTSENAAWLRIDPVSVDANGLGTYTARVDRRSLAGAFYATTIIVAVSGQESLRVPVSMQVNAAGGPENSAGYHYVLLIDKNTGETVKELRVAGSGGIYSFNFTDVAAGSYYLMAGTDSNNNGLICDPGEACGGYPTLDQLTAINVRTSSISGLGFISGFSIDLSPATALSAIAPKGLARLGK